MGGLFHIFQIFYKIFGSLIFEKVIFMWDLIYRSNEQNNLENCFTYL